jgi:C_GCAxxG_C_C family probable redox protein
MLEDSVANHYCATDVERNCSEALIYGANDEFLLDLPVEALRMMGPFGGGMRIESICGAITGALAMIGILYSSDNPIRRDRMKEIAERFLSEFKSRYGCLDCACLKDKYRDERKKCEPVVRMSARLLEEIIKEESRRPSEKE